MPKFLNTSAVSYHLEELIKGASERLVLISPYLQFNDRIRELLVDRDRYKIDIRIVYGKVDVHPDVNNWLNSLAFVRTSFCKNLHAKCYLNESRAIITSMNLYEFSQVNNNEMGVLIERDTDGPLYTDTYQEAQRLIRISEELKVTVEKVSREEDATVAEKARTNTTTKQPTRDGVGWTPSSDNPAVESAPALAAPKQPRVGQPPSADSSPTTTKKLSTSKLAELKGIRKAELDAKLEAKGLMTKDGDKWKLTSEGVNAGGEVKRGQYGEYIAWPEGVV